MQNGKCQYVDFFCKQCDADSDWIVYDVNGKQSECCTAHQHHFATTFVERDKSLPQADGTS